MRKPVIQALRAASSIILVVAGTSAWAQAGEDESWADKTFEELVPERPTYTTADELREACKRYLKPMDPGEAKARPYHDYLLFVVPYLGSKDAELRDAAVDILAQVFRLRRHPSASAFSKYLSRDYPLNVRLVALAHSLYGRMAKGEMIARAERRALMEEAWTEALNDVAESPVTPPNFDVLVFALMIRHDCLTMITPENRPVMMRRLLAIASGGTPDDRRYALDVITCFPMDTAAAEVVAWYRAQPDVQVRAAYVERLVALSNRLSSFWTEPSSVDQLKALLPVLELAAQDTDPDIAKKTKAAFEKANAFLEKSMNSQDRVNE